jgi:transcriptional regulator
MQAMYLPSAFAITDRAALLAHASRSPFATVITHVSALDARLMGNLPCDPDDLAVSHLPLLVDAERGVLRGHLARDNPQYRHFALGAPSLTVFHGPHGYVSPSVYSEPGVPTWNYVVVHARGRARLVDEAGLRAILDDTVRAFDTTGWTMSAIEESLGPKLGAIAGFEIELSHLEGKWKLSQNRSPGDQVRVIQWLERGDESSRATAALMRVRLPSS